MEAVTAENFQVIRDGNALHNCKATYDSIAPSVSSLNVLSSGFGHSKIVESFLYTLIQVLAFLNHIYLIAFI